MKIQKVYLKIKDKVKEIERRISYEDIQCNSISNCLEFVKNNVKDTCLTKAIILYNLLKKLSYDSCYIVILKPHYRKDIYLHAIVIIKQKRNILALDPMVNASNNFPYNSIESYNNLDEINEKIGDIICIFNDEEAYIKQ